MKLFEHQRKIIDDDPKWCGLFLGTGGAKTRTALELAEGKTLVIAPKTQVLDENWIRENETWSVGVDLTIISKEQFRRDAEKLEAFDTVIVDEAHTVAGVYPVTKRKNGRSVPQASMLFTSLHEYIERHPPKRFYLLTATPVRSPMTVWAFATLLGYSWNFYDFRDTFYFKLPMPGREAWAPTKDGEAKERLARAVRKLGYTGRLEDWFDVPEQTHKTMSCPMTKAQEDAHKEIKLHYPDPLVLVGKMHQIENGVLQEEFEETRVFKSGKVDAILDLYEEFGRVLVFAKYRAQIEALEAELSKKTKVFTLTGDTKDRGELMRKARESEGCIFIAQSQISSGYELPSFRCTVFASMSHSVVDLVQSWGRTQRANNIQKNLYVYLLSGPVDRAIYKTVAVDKTEFHEKVFAESMVQ